MRKIPKFLRKFCHAPDYIKCYLCLQLVKEKHWDSGNHRYQCMKNNKTKFESFLEHPDICCEKCGRKLRLWTDQGTFFMCNSNFAACKSKGTSRETSRGNRYSCFICDFDLCIECKNVVEERRQHRRAKVERKLRKRSNRISSEAVEDVVCLKTLCDKVAQIERSKLEKLKSSVSVGVNTDIATEDESSECVTVIERDAANCSDMEELDLSPIDADPDIVINEEQTDTALSLAVEIHLENGSVIEQTEVLVNGHISDDEDFEDIDSNHNHKPLLSEKLKSIQTDSPLFRNHSCSCPISSKNSRLLSLLRSDSLLSMSESPDIFHLRAPLVSWENFLTPSLSDESLC